MDKQACLEKAIAEECVKLLMKLHQVGWDHMTHITVLVMKMQYYSFLVSSPPSFPASTAQSHPDPEERKKVRSRQSDPISLAFTGLDFIFVTARLLRLEHQVILKTRRHKDPGTKNTFRPQVLQHQRMLASDSSIIVFIVIFIRFACRMCNQSSYLRGLIL